LPGYLDKGTFGVEVFDLRSHVIAMGGFAIPAPPTPWLPHQKPHSGRPLIRGHERAANGTN
jgi:hypothetical protein